MELTRHPGDIRSMQFNLADQLDWEQYSRELMSFLPTTLLCFASNFMTQG